MSEISDTKETVPGDVEGKAADGRPGIAILRESFDGLAAIETEAAPFGSLNKNSGGISSGERMGKDDRELHDTSPTHVRSTSPMFVSGMSSLAGVLSRQIPRGGSRCCAALRPCISGAPQ